MRAGRRPSRCWCRGQRSTLKDWWEATPGRAGRPFLPGRAVAKIDMRLVPDMTAMEALAAFKAHLAKKGFGDIEVKMSGGYDPTSTAVDAVVIRVESAVYKRNGI